jgi:hypothetical protein
MTSPFHYRPLPEQGFFGRMFGRMNREALLAEVENLLADSADWASVTRAEIAKLEETYGGSLKESAAGDAIMLICRAADSLSPQAVVEGGARRLRALAAAFDMSAQAESVVQSRARAALAVAAGGLIADGDLTDPERAAFDAAAAECGFEPEAVASILSDAVTAMMKAEIAAAVADGRLTGDEEARIDELGHALSAQLDLDDATLDQLARARRLWQVEDGPLTAVQAPLELPKTEICLYAGYGQVMEPRTRGAKSFIHSYGAGDIVLTDRRLLFNGGQKNLAVRLNLVVDYQLFDDGVEVRRATGKPLTFALNTKDEWFARLFVRARRDAG